MDFADLTGRITAFFESERGKKYLKWAQRIINFVVAGWLIYQLTAIGWADFGRALPQTPLFYILFVVLFLQLPLFEVGIYRFLWTFDTVRAIPAFILKRVYNKDVMDYSGELFFIGWARETLQLPAMDVLKTVKDNNIISSVASTLISIGLLAGFFFTGQIKLVQQIAGENQYYFLAGIILIIILVALFIKFRHTVISMPLRTAYKIFGIQVSRLLIGQFFILLMFYVVLPDVPLHIWFTFMAVQLILSRIPFLPNMDFIFASIAISLAGSMPIAPEAVAGIVVTRGVLNKVGGAIVFGINHILKANNLIDQPKATLESSAFMQDEEEKANKEKPKIANDSVDKNEKDGQVFSK